MNAVEKQLEEVKRAQPKLKALLDALIVVRGDSTAMDILDEVLDSTADGTGTDSYDLKDLFTVAFAHSLARVEALQKVLPNAERAA